jgi:hypothetical protein
MSTVIGSSPVAPASLELEREPHAPMLEGSPSIILEPSSPTGSIGTRIVGSSPPPHTAPEVTSTAPAASPSLVVEMKRSRREARLSGDLEIDDRRYHMTYYNGAARFQGYSAFALPVRLPIYLTKTSAYWCHQSDEVSVDGLS